MAPTTPERASAEASALAAGCRSYLASLEARAAALSRLSSAFVPFLDAAAASSSSGGGNGNGGSGTGNSDAAAAARRYREAAEGAAAALKESAPVAAELLSLLRRASLHARSSSSSSEAAAAASPSPSPSSTVLAVEAAEAAQREALRLTVVLHGVRKAATEGLKRESSGGGGGGRSCGHSCGGNHEGKGEDGLFEARLRSERDEALAEATAALQEAATTVGEARAEIAEAAAEFEEMV